jgi:DNA transformation protein and related proteins
LTKTSGFLEYVLGDLLNETPGITSRAMFGGWSLYRDGVIFGMIDDDRLYFKAGEENLKDFQEMGSKPFTYQMKNGKSGTMNYYEVPEEIMENRELLSAWVEKAMQVSLNSK